MDPISEIVRPENLYWSWEKAKRIFSSDAAWFDDLEVARFEGNLEFELKDIAEALNSCEYQCSPLRPVPHPKGSDRNSLEVRQSFIVSPRDQVAWLALINVVGPVLDEQMPRWSFGNRLYRPVWLDDQEQDLQWKYGPYRHSGGLLYRKFQHSWTLYKRYVSLTVRAMDRQARAGLPESELEAQLLEQERSAAPHRKFSYLASGYWRDTTGKVCWMGLDFKKFYPNLNAEIISANLIAFLPPEMDASRLTPLVKSMMDFPVDLQGLQPSLLQEMSFVPGQTKLTGIPTGLFVSGFLANVAMLQVDNALSELSSIRQVAHFRYVDDHIVLARSLSDLIAWMNTYTHLLEKYQVGARINPDKTQPEGIRDCLAEAVVGVNILDETKLSKAELVCRVDPLYPTPLLTATLNKVSQLASLEFELLDDQEKAAYLSELEHLMLAEIADSELPHATRRSFAASLLTRLVPGWSPGGSKWIESDILLSRLNLERDDLTKKARFVGVGSMAAAEVLQRLGQNQIERGVIQKKLSAESNAFAEAVFKRRNHFSGVVRHALHQHPGKARLWQRYLEYGFRTGIRVCGHIIDELDTAQQLNEPAARYLRAYVVRSASELLLRAVIELASDDIPEDARKARSRFVQDVLLKWAGFLPLENLWWFETRSSDLMRFSIGTSRLFLNCVNNLEDLDDSISDEEKWRAIRWEHNPRKWAQETKIDLSIWVWWLEKLIAPSKVHRLKGALELMGRSLHTADSLSWKIWWRYPSLIPAFALNDLLAGKLTSGQEGWLYGVLSRMSQSELSKIQSSDSRVDRLLALAKRSVKGGIYTLSEWIRWTARLSQTAPHDPRVGEWTALTIAMQVSEALQTIDGASGRLGVHPSNFAIPPEWVAAGDSDGEMLQLTWEAWRSTIETHPIRFVDKSHQIYDARLAPTWEVDTPGADDGALTHAVGVLLLFLLSHSLDLPAEWNPLGHQRAWPRPIRKLIWAVPCSSWSRAILEQCLLPRGRETFILKSYASRLGLTWADDSLRDPPEIRDLAELGDLLQDGRAELRSMQVSMPGHAPRQIVPIVLYPMIRGFWRSARDKS